MTPEQLRRANTLNNTISNLNDDIKGINEILLDYNNFGSNISFKRNSDGFSRSFGSAKYHFRKPLKEILISLKESTESELLVLMEEFQNLK